MISIAEFQDALKLLDRSERIVITTHIKPDGDACGSLVALYRALTARGKNVSALFLTECPSWYTFLIHEQIPVLARDVTLDQLERQGYDLVVLVDVNSLSQLTNLEDYVRDPARSVLVIDHHPTGEGLGTIELIDDTAGATGIIVKEFLAFAQWPLRLDIAEALFVAIATDTGWLQFGNAHSREYRACADLIDMGVDPRDIYSKLYHNFSFERFQLMRAMLDTLVLFFEGRFAVQYLRKEDFERIGAHYEDTENLINECHRIDSVVVSALLVELADGRIRCSLRSRGAVDVSQIALQFGGGGHKMASGTFLPGPLENALGVINKTIASCLNENKNDVSKD